MREELQRQMTTMAEGVDRFQREILDLPCEPRPLPPARAEFRIKFLREELDEFVTAVEAGKFTDQIDALVDLVYVAIGGILEMGVDPIHAFEPVQEANMAKVRGETARGDHYDAVKPEGWTPPDHDKMLEELRLRYAVRPSLLEATRVVLERGATYNHGEDVKREDHFPLGAASVFQMIWVKVIRMKADIQAGRQPHRDHPRDIINYCDFLMCLLDGRPM